MYFRRLKEVARELLDYKVALKINDPNEPKLIVNCITAYSRGEINLDDMMNTFKVIRGGIITSTSISRIFQKHSVTRRDVQDHERRLCSVQRHKTMGYSSIFTKLTMSKRNYGHVFQLRFQSMILHVPQDPFCLTDSFTDQ
jgi:hypothetical protein